MGQIDDLETRAKGLIAELSDIVQSLQNEIGNEKKSISFSQVKEIEGSIARMKKQGIPVPEELKNSKIKLFSEHELHQARIALHKKIQDGLFLILNRTTTIPQRNLNVYSQRNNSPRRKPSNYEKPLGAKGFSNLEDYLIPVIQLMWDGLDHKEAFRKIAQKLDVRYNTVSSQCTRALNLTIGEFIHQVESKMIISLLKKKYPGGGFNGCFHLDYWHR